MIEILNWIGTHLDETVLIFCSASIAMMLILWHLDKKNPVDVRDLLVDPKNKELSLSKTGQAIALLTSTWIIIHETKVGRLSEWLFIGYMVAWGGVNLANKYINNKTNSAATEEKKE